MRIRLIAISAVFSILAGCSSMNPPDSFYHAQATRAAVIASVAQKPVLRITGGVKCANESIGCTIEVFDPRSAERMAMIERGTTAADVAIKGLGVLGGVAQWGIAGYAAVRAIESVGDRQYNVLNEGDGEITFQQDYHANQLSSTGDVSETVGDTITGDTTGDTITSGDTSGDTVTSGDTWGANANNSGRITSPDDYTSDPTVVDQPDPVIVQ